MARSKPATRMQDPHQEERHWCEVIAGKDAGKRGKVLKVLREKSRVIVQGVGFIKRHTRPNPQRNIKGGIAEREAADPRLERDGRSRADDDKRTRIGSKTLADGAQGPDLPPQRGEVLDK